MPCRSACSATDDIYAAMDWLAGRQDAIEAELARRHQAPQANPSRMALFDLSSSWLEGSCCPLADPAQLLRQLERQAASAGPDLHIKPFLLDITHR